MLRLLWFFFGPASCFPAVVFVCLVDDWWWCCVLHAEVIFWLLLYNYSFVCWSVLPSSVIGGWIVATTLGGVDVVWWMQHFYLCSSCVFSLLHDVLRRGRRRRESVRGGGRGGVSNRLKRWLMRRWLSWCQLILTWSQIHIIFSRRKKEIQLKKAKLALRLKNQWKEHEPYLAFLFQRYLTQKRYVMNK